MLAPRPAKTALVAPQLTTLTTWVASWGLTLRAPVCAMHSGRAAKTLKAEWERPSGPAKAANSSAVNHPGSETYDQKNGDVGVNAGLLALGKAPLPCLCNVHHAMPMQCIMLHTILSMCRFSPCDAPSNDAPCHSMHHSVLTTPCTPLCALPRLRCSWRLPPISRRAMCPTATRR